VAGESVDGAAVADLWEKIGGWVTERLRQRERRGWLVGSCKGRGEMVLGRGNCGKREMVGAPFVSLVSAGERSGCFG
jgi:hypothetical protein